MTEQQYSVWRIIPGGPDRLWDGPFTAEDAEKVRFTRQRDAWGNDDDDSKFVVRPGYDLSEQKDD